MNEKIVDLIKEKDIHIPSLLFRNYKKIELTEQELILVIYFINNNESFNPKVTMKYLDLNLEELMNMITSLTAKNILKIEMTKGKIKEEYINLDGLYQKLFFIIINKKTKKNNNLFDVFEKELGRNLSPMDYEIIETFKKNYSDTLINLAIKEAVFNETLSLKYIDKILKEWKDKNIKNEEDIVKNRKKSDTKKRDKKLFDYDWLNE